MRLMKPGWISHDGHSIFSIDIHPDRTRFATGGQGNDSTGRIVIWNMEPIMQFEAEKTNGHGENSDIPKLLCQLDHHNACVNCVRWSNSGQYLASAGDDRVIIIWKLVSKQRPNSTIMSIPSAFGKPNYETWKSITELRSHSGDILHLAWSPEDKYLASASVDNKVIIWDAKQFPMLICELNGHSSLCKGVTWDPVGKYVATQSDDKTLKIWRTSDWQVEQTISDPFIECGGTTHALRLDWSPDGFFLVSAHAMNAGGPTAQIIERDEWKTDKDFVGHRKAVTCVRFNQNIHQQDKNRYCYVALGSRDRSISVWSTLLQRPVVVIHDLFKDSVVDLSWSSCGKILMACSWDGTVAFLRFTSSEVGKALTNEEKALMYQKFYGTKTALETSEVAVQNLEVFLSMQKNEKYEPTPVTKSQPVKQAFERTPESEASQSQEPIIRGPIDKQIETRTSDGKRRITPKFLLPCPSDGTSDVLKSDESNSNHFGTMSAVKDSEKKEQVSLRDKMISNINEVKIPNETVTTQNNTNGTLLLDKENEKNHEIESKQSAEPKIDSINDSQNITDLRKTDVSQSENSLEKNDSQNDEMSQEEVNEDHASSEDSGDTFINSVKRKRISDEMKPPNTLIPKKPKLQPPASAPSVAPQAVPAPTSSTSLALALPSTSANANASPSAKLPAILPSIPSQPPNITLVNGHASSSPPVKHSASSPRARLPPMKVDSILHRRVQSKKDINYTLEVNNKLETKGGYLVVCQHDLSSLKGLRWNIWTSFPICSISGDSSRVVALCEDNTVHVLDVKGRYSLPPLILNSFPSKMLQHGCYLLIITVRATLHVWNIYTKKNIIKSESVSPLLEQNRSTEVTRPEPIEILHMNISSAGSPILLLSNGRAFHFNKDMKAWMQYSDPGTSFNSLNSEMKQPLTKYKLTNLQLRDLRQSEPYAITQIKLKLASATELQLKDGVHSCLIALAKSLVIYGLTAELHQLCEDLLGPAHSSAKLSSSWNPTIVGVNKRKVLQEILQILSQDLQWQEFYSEFTDLLANLEENSNDIEMELENVNGT